ncbi:Single-stranded DNA-binding protein (fragment) [Candidatus Desulfosporosinus infrequens]|uniref:Single-stranded DNA-binding protein n=1 Tax=Candidatus Desulfosporosinus infrequens TaxID=2043169 RepID=A0A2U3L6Q5_9FIRM
MVCSFTLAVRREFKNQAGEYESDFLTALLTEKQVS